MQTYSEIAKVLKNKREKTNKTKTVPFNILASHQQVDKNKDKNNFSPDNYVKIWKGLKMPLNVWKTASQKYKPTRQLNILCAVDFCQITIFTFFLK